MNNVEIKAQFKLDVTILNPTCDDVLDYRLVATFTQDYDTYGNGYWLSIRSYQGEHFERYYDLRYSNIFRRDYPEKYLLDWVTAFWTGREGAWKIMTLSLTPLKL